MQRDKVFTLYNRLWAHILPRRKKQIGLLIVLMFITSLAEVVSIGAVIPFLGILANPESIFDNSIAQPYIHLIGVSNPKDMVMPLTVVFILAALFAGVMRITLLWGQTRLAHAIGADLGYHTYRRTLYQPYAVHVVRNSSEVIAGVSSKVNQVVSQAILPLLTIISSILMLTMILSALIVIDPIVATSAIAGIAMIYGFFVTLSKNRLLENGKQISRQTNQVVKTLQEGLGGIRDVLIDGAQSAYCLAFRSADIPLRRAIVNNQIIAQSPRYGVESMGMVLIACLAYILGSSEEGLVPSLPVLGALAVGAQRGLPLLQQGYGGWSQIRGAQAVFKDVLSLIEQPLPNYAKADTVITDVPFQQSIMLKDVWFRYSADSPWVLKGIDLEIPKGARIGFIGTTGSGKSTLLDVIMGLLHPSKGCLFIDGVEVTDQNHRGWQSHIAHIPQSIFLSDASIIENIAFGQSIEQINFERVKEAAQQAQIAESIESWEEQYQTVIGEQGVRLSGGQRQRIGIARALYKRAGIVILDEATSALDSATEKAVIEAVNGVDEDVTILMVAHRLTTLESCDSIVELEQGVIKRSGSYRDIVGR